MKTRESFLPAYYQLADDIRQQILSGQLKPGDALPTEIQIGEQYGISKMTVRNGLRLLLDEGLIESFRGKGSFVAKPKLNVVALELEENIFKDPEKTTMKFLGINIITADERVAETLQLKAGTKVFCFHRLFLTNDEPISLEYRYLTYHRGQPVIEQEIQYAAFPEVVAKHTGIVTERNQVTISSVGLSLEEAEQLQTRAGAPALKIEQLVFGRGNQPLGLSVMICRGEKYNLVASTQKFF